jgi:hypothetical protein
MFVKWKPGRLTRGARGASFLWDHYIRRAYLVRSVRTEEGPRHKHICYIGSFLFAPEPQVPPKCVDDCIDVVIEELHGSWADRARRFWRTATANLDRAGIAGADRAKVEAALAAVVPKPGKASRAAAGRGPGKLKDHRKKGR